MIGNMKSPFMWGSKGQKLTPEQVERERARADAMLQGVGDTSPVQHWLQGAGRVVNAITGKIQDRRASASEEMGLASADDYIANNPVLAGLIGSGGSGVSMGIPATAGTGPTVMEGRNTAMAQNGGPTVAAANALEGGLPASIVRTESGGNWNALNSEGYGGRGQFGEARLADAARAGIIPPGMTGAMYSKAPEAVQIAVENWHKNDILKDLGQYVGADVDGPGPIPPLTENSLLAVAHLGGTGGARKFVETGGRYNPADSNGTRLSDYATTHAGGSAPSGGSYGGAQPQNSAGVIQALAGAMSDPWVAKKYGPVIEALMGQQMKRGDMQYQQQLAQSDPMYQAQLANATRPEPVDPWAGTQVINGQVVRMGANGPEAIGDFNTPEPGYQMVSPEEVAQLGLPEGAYQRGADGKISAVGGGGVTNNIDMGGDKFAEAFAKGDATMLGTVAESGMAAQRNLGRIDQLEGLLNQSPTGLAGAVKQAAGEFGVNTEGLSDIQAAQALINSLVPEQRQPGSGPMSDADLALFKQSLPRIINQKGGNATIIQTMRAIAQYDAEGAAIVQRLRSGEIDRSQAFAALQGRANPLAGFKVPEKAPYADFGAALQGPAAGGASTYRYNPETGKIEAVQ